MITQMEVFTSGITEPPIPIVDQAPGLDPIQIKNIDGLGPVTATVNTTQYGSIDGEAYSGSYVPKRNIVLTLALNPNWGDQTFEDLRQILYSYFMPKNQVRLRFTSTHLALVEIEGYIESFEPDMFSKDPEYQVSIICPEPYFVAVNATVVQGITQSFTDPVNVPITYEGNAEVGFVTDITLPDEGIAFSGEIRLINSTPTTKLAIISPVIVDTTKFFRFSTVEGSKFARQYPLPSGLPINILSAVQPGSGWLTLRKGVNQLQILSQVAGLQWSLQYYARYGGL